MTSTSRLLMSTASKSEREQGITIDVAYRYFTTDRRRFIVADTPGHERAPDARRTERSGNV